MILSRIELKETRTTKTWADNVEVEHIAPKAWKDDWKDKKKGGGFTDEKEKNKYLDYLGNRTLLNPGDNQKLLNNSFHEKQTHPEAGYDMQATTWAITKDLESKKIKLWGAAQVEERTELLVKKMLDIYDDNFMK